jgi:EAL domain-containing protein (putative c-di-GMP-specific phosphodiesterase class I)/GGDEF domain-containing protein
VVHLRDISETKQLRHRLHRVTFVDQFTGLPNLSQLHKVLAGRDTPGVLMVLGLSGFAELNATRGAGVTDPILVEAARRLQEGAGPTDLPVRLEGARFAVLTDAGALQAQFLACSLLTRLAAPYALPAGSVSRLLPRAGLAEFTAGDDANEVLRRAALALRLATQPDHDDAVAWYHESIEGSLQRQVTLEQQLPLAVERGELDLGYQPVVDMRTGQVTGVEAMLRWHHPSFGMVDPEEFLPLAAELGMLDQIGTWTIGRVCQLLSVWRTYQYDLWISLDITVDWLVHPAFIATVENAISTFEVPASRLIFEVGEAGLSTSGHDRSRHGYQVDPAADARSEAITQQLTELRMRGSRIALDHFGNLANSLSRLRIMPVDLLKVDRNLFANPRGSGSGQQTPVIVDAVVRLAQQLGLEVAAVDLDSAPDLGLARGVGCDFGQGTMLSPPLPAEHLEAYLADAYQAGAQPPSWIDRSSNWAQ